jgi:hypothetical protein
MRSASFRFLEEAAAVVPMQRAAFRHQVVRSKACDCLQAEAAAVQKESR